MGLARGPKQLGLMLKLGVVRPNEYSQQTLQHSLKTSDPQQQK